MGVTFVLIHYNIINIFFITKYIYIKWIIKFVKFFLTKNGNFNRIIKKNFGLLKNSELYCLFRRNLNL